MDHSDSTSWSAYTSKRRRVETDKPGTDSAETVFSRSNTSYRTKDVPTGISALYHQAPAGIDTRLQFQWMRIHPATAFAESNAGRSSHPAVEFSSMVEHFENANTSLGKKRSLGSKAGRGYESFPRRILHLPQVKVDLTKLIDPPMLSDWLPGTNTEISYDVDDDRKGPISVEASSSVTAATHDLNEWLDFLIKAAINELDDECSEKPETALIRHRESVLMVTTLPNLSPEKLMEVLPSHILMLQIERCLSGRKTEKRQSVALSVRILTLCLMAEKYANEAVGRHILTVLAPALFAPSEKEQINTHQHNPYRLSRNQRQNLQRLADALLSNCLLGKLPKKDLRKIASSEADGYLNSEALEELLISIGDVYHKPR